MAHSRSCSGWRRSNSGSGELVRLHWFRKLILDGFERMDKESPTEQERAALRKGNCVEVGDGSQRLNGGFREKWARREVNWRSGNVEPGERREVMRIAHGRQVLTTTRCSRCS